MIGMCFPKITRIGFIVLKICGNQKMKLYALNKEESRKYPSCIAIPPPL